MLKIRPNLIKFRRKKGNKSTRNKIKVILYNIDNEGKKSCTDQDSNHEP